MNLSLQTRHYTFGKITLALYEPVQDEIREHHRKALVSNPATPFPYWAKVWPASRALSLFLAEHPDYVSGKKVLELGGGLGLPSLCASKLGAKVYFSDCEKKALELATASAQLNNLRNMECLLIDWTQSTEWPVTDVVIASDINYDTAGFEGLYSLLEMLLARNITLILSTPHRLSASSFIKSILPWCTMQKEIEVQDQGEFVLNSVFVLRQSNLKT
jgi:predicted nicotinamide N-methyase